ncbi:conserved hypothetical exported protein [Taylorella asinigenitalis 14/45]|uniref:Conserved hypothetical exported protein n=1 Tax=Taylorella asinigenitalis 14/45 TaxID=1091495 RepID=I7IKB6_9BURK|nr:SIMPL domain-containing protein [Taylorella asinigenitalis]CCG19047.1 conserved hypothetical exported protein [Taylorella asinigenitalis 14/45]
MTKSFFKIPLIAIALSTAFIAPIQAQTQEPSDTEAKEEKTRFKPIDSPKFNVSASVRKKVTADYVELILRKELSGKDLDSMTKEINKAMDEVIQKAKEFPDLEISTNNYNFWKEYSGRYSSSESFKPENIIWNVQGSVIVASSDHKKVEEFIKSIGTTMIPDNINFSLTPEARKKAESEILQQAADEFKAKADTVTKAFGFTSYTIGKVTMNKSEPAYYNYGYRGMADSSKAMAKSNGVPLAPNSIDVYVSFSGEIYPK